jgi:hypothetical protein
MPANDTLVIEIDHLDNAIARRPLCATSRDAPNQNAQPLTEPKQNVVVLLQGGV